jgi:hypothetical protein
VTAAADLTDKVLFDNNGNVAIPITIMPTNTPAVGDPAYLFGAAQSNFSSGATHGELLGYTVSGVGGSSGYPLVRGCVLENATTARTTTNPGTATDAIGAVSATQYLYATLHVVAIPSSNSLDVQIQSSPNGSSGWTNRATFTQVISTITSQYITRVAGPITDTYWRANWIVSSGSYTFAVAAGIK